MPRKSSVSPPLRGKVSSSRNVARATARQASRTQPAASAADASGATLQAPFSLATVWSQFAQQVQRASEQTLQGLSDDAKVETEAVRRADTPQQLAGLPIGLAAEQVTRWAQLSTQLAAGLLDVQAAWLKEVESVATQMIGPLFARDGRITLGSAQDIVEPPEPSGPMQMLLSTQRVWSESAKVWLHAMSHDLQGDPPNPLTTATRSA